MNGTDLGFDSRFAYTALVGLVAIQRLGELVVSRRNFGRLRNRGGFEVGGGGYPWIVALHSAFLVSCVAEVWLLQRPWKIEVAVVASLLLVVALGLRWWTLATLGARWTTRVVVVPGEHLVKTGPYRWLRHPNYLAVVVEIAAIPMIHSAWLTAVIFSAANLAILRHRIAAEERALREFADKEVVIDRGGA